MAEHPKVFISYSHDSPEHRRWVSELGAKLRHNGVDAILDQWDLGPGDDVTQFMERGIIDSDRVLVICTDTYVGKANAGEGGVGYERMIVTAQLIQDLGTNKFIPVIRQASGKEETPTFLGTRVYIDFRNDSQFESEFEKLIRELHRMPVVERPPLGKNPFAKLPSGQKASPSEGLDTQLPEIPEQIESPDEAYSEAVKLARGGDVLGWRELIKQIKPSVFKSLAQRRQEGRTGELPTDAERFQAVDETVKIIAPLICVALVGVASGREQFRDQKSILDDLLNSARWNRANVSVNLRHTLGYIYHSLHGSLSFSTNQLDLGLSLARVKIPDLLYTTEHLHVWKRCELMGWSELFGRDCTKGWKYLVEAYDRWEWLAPIFVDELEYRTSLVAYYMALDIHELASTIASGRQGMFKDVPLGFISEGHDINQRAISQLLRDPEALKELWSSLDVTREQMESSQGDWIRVSEGWLREVYKFSADTRIYHENLSKVLQP